MFLASLASSCMKTAFGCTIFSVVCFMLGELKGVVKEVNFHVENVYSECF